MSKIEVNEIDAQSGSTITVGSACKSVAVPGNVVKTNAVQASDAGNIISQSGTTITIGASGDTVSLASGASQSGFGRSGTVDWQTSIKTSTFTAASGEGYFVDTSSGGVTVNLPAGTAGSIVAVKDYSQTFDTNTCTISPNGSQKIENLDSDLLLETEGKAVTLVYGDDTKGWQAVNSNDVVNSVRYIAASGGTESTSGNFKIHAFTGPGTFTVSCGGNSAGSNTVDYLVVAGGGGASGDRGGGGGAGGYRFSNGTASGCYTAGPSPLGATALPVSAQGYPITVGAGGSGANPSTNAGAGSNSIFSTITSTGGGRGARQGNTSATGGSGGGGAGIGPNSNSAGSAGNNPPVTPSQGNDGGDGNGDESGPVRRGGGGGGGASAVGTTATTSQNGNGGAGLTSCITASPVARGGGGGGGGTGGSFPNGGTGGSGGGGTGGTPPSISGTANTGGGGGGFHGNAPCNGGSGGSGVVIIRYKFQ
jgi:hypothetical protein